MRPVRRTAQVVAALTLVGSGALLSIPAFVSPAAAADDFALSVTVSHTPTTPAPGQAVQFTADIANPTAHVVTITGITSNLTNPVATLSPCDADGPGTDLVGTALGAGTSVTCTFTVDGYAGPAGDSRDHTVSVTATASVAGGTSAPGTQFVVVDENSIDNGAFYVPVATGVAEQWDAAVLSDGSPGEAQRSPIPFFENHEGQQFLIRGGAGSAAFHTIDVGALPSGWTTAGPTADPVRNFVGNPDIEPGHEVPAGLGGGGDLSLLDEIDGDALESAADLTALAQATQICAVVKDSDVGANDGNGNSPNVLNFQGGYLGVAAFRIDEVVIGDDIPSALDSGSPALRITVLDTDAVCGVPEAGTLNGGGTATDAVVTAADSGPGDGGSGDGGPGDGGPGDGGPGDGGPGDGGPGDGGPGDGGPGDGGPGDGGPGEGGPGDGGPGLGGPGDGGPGPQGPTTAESGETPPATPAPKIAAAAPQAAVVVEVKGQQVSLPRTGADPSSLLGAAGMLLVLGGAALGASAGRQRRFAMR